MLPDPLLSIRQQMPDMQQSPDERRIAIDQVGVKDIRYPIVVQDKYRERQYTVARVNMYVDLPAHFKGTHMSRFIEVLNLYHGEISVDNIETILTEMKSRLGADRAHLELDFPYFIEKRAPVSGARGLLEYQCRMVGTLSDQFDFMLEARVPVTSLCPCSKEISERGAHNQRSLVALDNLVDFIITCIDHPAAVNQTFLVADGEDLSTTELLRRVGQAMGKPARLLPVPMGMLKLGAALLGKKDVAQRLCGNLQVDISKAREVLRWEPVVSVEEGLGKAARVRNSE